MAEKPPSWRRQKADKLADELEQMIRDLERVSIQLAQELHDDQPGPAANPA